MMKAKKTASAVSRQVGIKGIRRDQELQARILEQRERGTNLRAISRELNINTWALKAWLASKDGSLASRSVQGAVFRRVEVTEHSQGVVDEASPPPAPSRRLYSVYGPLGVRVEGMDATAISALMWELSGRVVRA